MSLSRKNKRELKKLRSHAAGLWQEQRDVIDRANSVVQEAALQAKKLSNQHVVPKVRGAVDEHVRPGFDRGYSAARSVSSSAKKKLVVDLLPGVATALGSITALANIIESPQVEHTIDRAKKASKAASKTGRKLAERYVPGVEPKRTGIGAGGIVAIVAGVIVVAGVGYAFWQTFRADDDLWIADDEVDTPPVSNTTSTPSPSSTSTTPSNSTTPPATLPPSVTGTNPIEPGTII